MLADRERRILEQYAQSISYTFAVAVDWDPEDEVLRPSTSVWRKLVELGQVLTCFFWICLSIWRLGKAASLGSTSQDPMLQVLYGFMLLVHAGYLVFALGLSIAKEKAALLYKQLMDMDAGIHEQQEADGEELEHQATATTPDNSHREKCFVYAQGLFLAAAMVGTIVTFTTEAFYCWDTTRSVKWAIISGVLAFGTSVQATFRFGFISTNLFVYFTTTKWILMTTTEASGDNIDKGLMQYRSLTVLNSVYNSTYCSFILPGLKCVMCLLIMFCVLLSTHLRIQLGVGLVMRCLGISAVYMFIALFLAASMMSGQWQLSKDFIWAFKHQKTDSTTSPLNRKYITACARSMCPLRIRMAGFYYMEREAKLTLVSFLATGTGNLLIAFK